MPIKEPPQTPPVPIPFSYEVVPGKLYAGEYPRDKEEDTSRAKIAAILDFGVTDFIDLTEEDELEPYSQLLPEGAGYYRFPVPDPGLAPVAEMLAIIQTIESLIDAGRMVYVHCWGGIDRTGGVVASWFVRRGLPPEEALGEYKRRWETNPKSGRRFMHIPAIQREPEYLDEFAKYLREQGKSG
jgi:protein-tyrosine phosphatase